MHLPEGRVHPDVRFHPEVPLVALLGLMHLRVTGASSVLRRGRRGDDRGINDAAAPHDPALLLEDLVLRLEQPGAELMLLQQMPKPQQRGRIRHLKRPRFSAVPIRGAALG